MSFEEDIKNAIKVLREGGIILYPSDTVWGLGCDPQNSEAIARIFEIKERSDSKSLILLADSEEMLSRYVKDIPAVAGQILSVSDRPLTIIYPSGKNLAPGVLAEDGSIGIRITDDHFCTQLLGRFRKPIVSTSANISGEASPATFGEISEKIKSRVDYIVTHRQEDRHKRSASPVIKVEMNGEIKIIRK